MYERVVKCFFLGLLISLTGCGQSQDEAFSLDDNVNVIDESNLNDLMLSLADPNESVAYFSKALTSEPERIDLRRGLCKSLSNARRFEEANLCWSEAVKDASATNQDNVEYAGVLLRLAEWEQAETVLDNVPPTYETYERYRLEAMISDNNREWERSDSYYEVAAGLTTQPATVYNNWGYSKLNRGAFLEAEELFTKAITYDNTLFIAKNNLMITRAAQRDYTLPILSLTKAEQAKLMHTAAVVATNQGDIDIARGLLEKAIAVHPRYFEEAVLTLRALNSRT